MMNILVYTKDNCPNCTAAKNLLKAKRLNYTEISGPDALRQLVEKHPDARQMPQIFINEQRVGGFAGLQAALRQMEI